MRVMYKPILKHVFKGECNVAEFNNIKILIPSSRIMVEMKLESILERTDKFKRAKDIADLFALLKYDNSNWRFDRNGNMTATKDINKNYIKKFKSHINAFSIDGTITDAVNMVKTDVQSIVDLLNKM